MIKTMERIRKSYRFNLKLRTKLLISHMTLIIIPTLVLTFTLYGKLYDIIVTDAILSEQALAEQTTSTIEATLTQITNVSHVMTENRIIQHMSEIGKDEAGDYIVAQDRMKEFEQYVKSLEDQSLITAIRIYVDESFEEILRIGREENISVVQPLSKVYGTYWYGIFNSKNITTLYSPSLYLSPRETRELGDMAYIFRMNFQTAEMEEAAYIAVYFNQEKFDDILKQNISISKGASYIINERDAMVASSDRTLSGAYLMTNDDIKTIIGSEKKYATKTFLGESYYVGYYNVINTNWRLVSILPMADLMDKGKLIVYMFFGFYILFSLVALAISMLISNSIVVRVRTVIEQMKSVKYGVPVPIEIKDVSKDEIGSLIDTYNYMSDEINNLLKEQEKSAEELRISEFKALQSQINPHFLYNSLDMINWLSLTGKQEEVTTAVQSLAKFYKLTLSKRNADATIGLELEHLTLYCKLQNMRYENRIDFLVDVSDELMDYQMPKLTLQPIVENSILHGIMEKDSKTGTIIIMGWREDRDIVLVVSDDGIGMEEEEVQGILTGKNKKKTGTNIGIDNTNSRLKLLFGEEYGLTFRSSPGKGTEVEIRIPAKLQENQS